MTPRRPSPRQIGIWALWDWGSAAFNAVMVTFVFGTYLASESFGADDRGTSWLAAGTAVAGVIVALTAPILGQRADRGGARKLWLSVNTIAVLIVMAGSFFVKPEESYLLLGVILLSAGNVFFEFAQVQYNAILVQIATRSTMGKVSGIGWGAGYLGGIFLLLILYVGFISGDTHWFGVSNDEAMNIRIVAVLAAVWFLLFSLPLLLTAPSPTPPSSEPGASHQQGQSSQHGKRSIVESYQQLGRTIAGLWRGERNTFWFLLASAVFRDGVGAVFTYGAILGTTVYGIGADDVLVFGIVANLVAAAGAFAGGWFDDRFGPKSVIMASLGGLIGVAATMYFLDGPTMFWIFGLVLCFFVGPVQSASRAFLGRLTTADRAGEIYGLYATTGRSVSFLTPGLIAVLVGIWGDSRMMIVAIVVVMLSGAALLLKVTDPVQHDEVAAEHS